MLDYWVCLNCRSINRPNASKCYSCRARKDTPLAVAEAAQPVVQAAPTPPPPRPFAVPAEAIPAPVPDAITQPLPDAITQPLPDAIPADTRTPPTSPSGTLDAAQRIAQLAAGASAAHRRAVLKRWLGRGLIAVGVVAVLVAGGVLLIGRGADRPPTRPTLTGRLDLTQAKGSGAPTFVELKGGQGACMGAGDYAGVRIGMPITVESDEGILIGQAWLDAGEVTTDGDGSSPACSFAFDVADLAPAAEYRVSAGALDSVDISLEALQAAGWEVTLTVGR